MIYRGQSALQTGILVAFTQLIPEHQVQLFGVIKMRVKVCPTLLHIRYAFLTQVTLLEPPNGVRHFLEYYVYNRIPSTVHPHPIRLA